jgi:hypothetical protein
MTTFSIDQNTDQPDRIFVEVDCRLNVAIICTEFGVELRVYPRTDGELWDGPFSTFDVNESEIVALEDEMER